jgi:putative lipoic acid-binding regulatory protein
LWNFSVGFELSFHGDAGKALESSVILEAAGDLTQGGSAEKVMKDVKAGKQSGLNAEIQARIGHQLRAMYDDVVRQGVPDRFAELIRRLDMPEADPQVGPLGSPEGGGE